jgi:hypothetical protein
MEAASPVLNKHKNRAIEDCLSCYKEVKWKHKKSEKAIRHLQMNLMKTDR